MITKRNYAPVSWTEYFDEAHDVHLDSGCGPAVAGLQPLLGHGQQENNSFRIYLRNFTHPFAPKRDFGQQLERPLEMSEAELNEYSKIPTLVALHGGGYSALTWAQFTRSIEQHCQCRVLAIDLRSHGDTKTDDDERMDIDTLVSDVINVTHAAHRICGFPETPKLVLIGHSMGGAIAVKCAMKSTELLPSLAGFVIIDVVEGTAKDALPLMMSVIKTRPTKFPSLSNAIEWSVRSGMAKNSDAARVSMPGNLLNVASGHLSIHDVEPSGADQNSRLNLLDVIKKHKFHISLEHLIPPSRHTISSLPRGLPLSPRVASLRRASYDHMPLPRGTIEEEPTAGQSGLDSSQPDTTTSDIAAPSPASREQTSNDDGYKKPPELDQTGYCWRTDLAKTQPFWSGWFDGLSEQLLAAPVQGKFLLLAGIDRLDKTLTIGQMQGKFMMKVLPKCGHAVHEDVPEQVASVIGQFLVRNKFTLPVE